MTEAYSGGAWTLDFTNVELDATITDVTVSLWKE